MRERVLVTGALGFQGVHLATALVQRGATVTLLNTMSPRARFLFTTAFKQAVAEMEVDRADYQVVWGSVTDADTLEKTLPGHDAVVHMAAWASVDQSLERPWPPFEVNAQGAMSVLEAVRRFADPGVRVVLASSCEVYGPAQPGYRQTDRLPTVLDPGDPPSGLVPQAEATPLLPRSPYAATKIAADRMAYAYAVTYGLDLVILRPCNVYGPWQRFGGFGAVIPTFVTRAKAGQPLLITGGGQQRREFLHVEDVVRAYLAALDAPDPWHGDVFNVGSGEVITIHALALQVANLVAGIGVRPHVPVTFSNARVADVSGFFLDSTRAHTVLGWKAQVPFADGLAHYVAWALLQDHV